MKKRKKDEREKNDLRESSSTKNILELITFLYRTMSFRISFFLLEQRHITAAFLNRPLTKIKIKPKNFIPIHSNDENAPPYCPPIFQYTLIVCTLSFLQYSLVIIYFIVLSYRFARRCCIHVIMIVLMAKFSCQDLTRLKSSQNGIYSLEQLTWNIHKQLE